MPDNKKYFIMYNDTWGEAEFTVEETGVLQRVLLNGNEIELNSGVLYHVLDDNKIFWICIDKDSCLYRIDYNPTIKGASYATLMSKTPGKIDIKNLFPSGVRLDPSIIKSASRQYNKMQLQKAEANRTSTELLIAEDIAALIRDPDFVRAERLDGLGRDVVREKP